MNIKKHLVYGIAAIAISAGVFSVVLAEDTANTSIIPSHPKPMIVQIGPEGKTLLRGTVKTVGTNSLVVTSWGGDWTINVLPDTKIMPGSDMSQFKVDDFVGVQGKVKENAAWTIDAILIRDWTARKEIQSTQKEIKKIMKESQPRNWQGTASTINVDTRTFTLIIEGTAYTINVISEAKVVNKNYFPIAFSSIKDGDTVRVWGPASDTTITASVVRDVSIK